MQKDSIEKSTDAIQQLIEASRAEERAKLAVETILKEINQRLTAIEATDRELSIGVRRACDAIEANYININTLLHTLLQMMAAIWHGDKSELSRIQQRLAEQAFAVKQDKDGGDITVEAHGDVRLSADRVGRDKRDGEEGEQKAR